MNRLEFYLLIMDWPHWAQHVAYWVVWLFKPIFSFVGLLLIANVYFFLKAPKGIVRRIFRPVKMDRETFFTLVGIVIFKLGLCFGFAMPWVRRSDFLQNEAETLLSGNFGAALNVAVLVLAMALVEEMLFRSFILTEAKRRRFLLVALLLTNVIFGFMHEAVLPQFISGFVLAWLFLKTGSVFWPTLYHFATNMMFLLIDGYDMTFPSKTLDFLYSENGLYVGFALMFIGIWPVLKVLREVIAEAVAHDSTRARVKARFV